MLTPLQCFLPGATLVPVSPHFEPVIIVVAVGCLDWFVDNHTS